MLSVMLSWHYCSTNKRTLIVKLRMQIEAKIQEKGWRLIASPLSCLTLCRFGILGRPARLVLCEMDLPIWARPSPPLGDMDPAMGKAPVVAACTVSDGTDRSGESEAKSPVDEECACLCFRRFLRRWWLLFLAPSLDFLRCLDRLFFRRPFLSCREPAVTFSTAFLVSCASEECAMRLVRFIFLYSPMR